MTYQLRAMPVLLKSDRAARVQLPSGRILWFPISQCHGLEQLHVGAEGDFSCPSWIVERESLQPDVEATSRPVVIRGQVLNCTQEAAFVRFCGGEELWLPFAKCPGLSALPAHTSGTFTCPAFLLAERDLLHYTMSPMGLAHALRMGSLSLEKAIYAGSIPEEVLHAFAHDCAQKVLQESSKLETEVLLCLWKAMQIKRRWMQEMADAPQLQEERDEIHRLWCKVTGETLNAVAAVWKATGFNGTKAADGASHHLICGVLSPSVSTRELAKGLERPEESDLYRERQWQSSHLAGLLEAHINSQRSQEKIPA